MIAVHIWPKNISADQTWLMDKKEKHAHISADALFIHLDSATDPMYAFPCNDYLKAVHVKRFS